MNKIEKIEYITIPTALAETAEARTKEIVRRWAFSQRNTLGELATSLYLQGIEDCVNAQHNPETTPTDSRVEELVSKWAGIIYHESSETTKDFLRSFAKELLNK